jgi:GDPmannose 4,6-dehydratase
VDTKKRALITGITGQDGSYLAELLLKNGYEVHGIKRRSSSFNTDRLDHIYQSPNVSERNFFLHYGDMTDSTNLTRIISDIEPNEIYNLAAQSHVKVSFETPEYTGNADALGVTRILEAIRQVGIEKCIKFYQASTSEMFGIAKSETLNESSPFHPRSPYGVAKLYAHWMTINYREAYGIFASTGILFNHESPRRGGTFVTKKIVDAAVAIANGKEKFVALGNLDAIRDWGHAKDYVNGMWKILQHPSPDDWVLATGMATSVREFTEKVFARIGFELIWVGSGLGEQGIDQYGNVRVIVDSKYFRPSEVPYLLGDASRARELLGWSPIYNLDMLIEEMISSALAL